MKVWHYKAQLLAQSSLLGIALWLQPQQAYAVEDPFAGSVMYVNPDYAAAAATSLAQVAPNSHDAHLIEVAQRLPTAVWLDRIAAIHGGSANGGRRSLTQHLDAALEQAAQAQQPVSVLLVIYDLPDRDCAAAASNGELQGLSGLHRYKHAYIDTIYNELKAKLQSLKTQNLRIALILEPDSLPNLVTNSSLPSCAAAVQDKLYEAGITYAIDKLARLDHVSIYLDIAHSGWLGWPNNMTETVRLYSRILNETRLNGALAVRGFATDVANYTPLQEPYVSPSDTALLSGPFYQWNPVFDELTYIKALNSQFTAAGFSDLHFIIDTSRSGWRLRNNGQPIDERTQRGNWCNVQNAGLGVRPQVAASSYEAPLDAFVYVKPPGESDGISHLENPQNLPDAQGKRFDIHCDPSNPLLNAMSDAPPAGTWFHAQFMMLLQNATPSL